MAECVFPTRELPPVFIDPFQRPIFLLSFLPFFLFQIPCALAPNAAVLLTFRFLAGAFGSSPLSNAGGTISDIWPADERGVATTLYSSGPWFGPSASFR